MVKSTLTIEYKNPPTSSEIEYFWLVQIFPLYDKPTA